MIGLMALLIGYYWVHKPITPDSLQQMSAGLESITATDASMMGTRIGGALLDMVTVAALFTIAGGLGTAVLSRLSGLSPGSRSVNAPALADMPDSESRAQNHRAGLWAALPASERLPISALLGLGLIALAALGAALAGVFTAAVLWGGLLALALGFNRGVTTWLRDLIASARTLNLGHGFERLLALVCIFFLVTVLLLALAPPTGWDGMVYQLVGPQRYLAEGRMTPAGDNFYLGMPKNGEMLFSIVISPLGRDTAAGLTHFGFGVLALALVWALARRQSNSQTGWMACALLLASYSLWALFGWPYVDLAVMAYAAAVYALVTRWRAAPDDRLLILIGALVGLAAGYKFTTLHIALGAGLLIALREPRRLVRNGVLVALAALLCLSPWLVRGWLQYGNPVYPVLGFGLNWDAERAAAFARTGAGALSRPDGWYILLLPLSATIIGTPLAPPTLFTTGPFLLTAPMLLPVVWRWLGEAPRGLARDCASMATPMLALWMYLAAASGTGEQTRLAIALLPVSAVLGALAFHGLATMPRKPVNLGFLVRAAFVITTLLTGVEVFAATAGTRVLLWYAGAVDTSHYLAHNLGVWKDAVDELARLPEGSRVRMAWELKTYYCPVTVTCIPDAMLDAWAHPIRAGQTPDAVFESWRAAGDDYLLLYGPGLDHFTHIDTWHRAENLRFPAALDQWMTPVWSDDIAYTLYTWRSP
jgi:hypothetical protein